MKTTAQELGFDFDIDEADSSYFTHGIHPYPAKFPPQIPKRILEQYGESGQTILDPFCGSGTTLVEARLKGINSIGIDVNGLACLLSKVKSTVMQYDDIMAVREFLAWAEERSFDWTMGKRSPVAVTDFEGLTHWFQANVAAEITLLISQINKIDRPSTRDFLRIVLSSIIVRVSNQESDTRFAAIDKKLPDGITLKLFIERAKDYIQRAMDFSQNAYLNSSVDVYNADSRNLDFIRDESIDMIITSPPYANTYDYYLYHKFRKRWLDIDVHFAQYNEIGSRREFSSLKRDPNKWLHDLGQCFAEMSRVLRDGCLAFVIIGDSVINKRIIRMDEEIERLASGRQMIVVHVLSSDLSSHSKIFNPAFAQKDKKEHLIMLQKSHVRN